MNSQNPEVAAVSAAPQREPVSFTQRVRNLLYVLAGAAPQDIARLEQRTGMQYGTLGAVFLLNLVILSGAWIAVGTTYFGAIGVLVPGLAVPAMFVLGLDRLVAMRGRRLTGELAGFNLPEAAGPNWEPALRVAMALALASLTTMTFLMSQSRDSIHELQNQDARQSNRAMRQELTERIDAAYEQRASQQQAREERLALDRQEQQARLESLTQQLSSIEARARRARDEAAMESGGLDNRVRGNGPRHAAQMQLANQNEAAAQDLRARQRATAAARQATDKEIAELAGAANANLAERNQAMARLDDAMKADQRYVAPRRGLFADATAFVRLYADPTEAAGRWLFTVFAVAVMFALESAALLALALNPSSPLDVLRMARNRETASAIVAESEIAVARTRAAAAPIHVRPAAGRATATPDAAANGENGNLSQGRA